MRVVGVTGHRNLTAPTRPLVMTAIAAELAEIGGPDVVGVSSLAAGADQIFAFCVLAAGGRLAAVLPAQDYPATLRGADRHHFDHLLQLAHESETLPFPRSTDQAYLAAGRQVVKRCDLLLAVWDGRPAGGVGGTADIVAYGLDQGVTVRVIWPAGARRH